MERENSAPPAEKESKAAETNTKSKMAIAIVAVVLMILGLANVVLNIYSMTTGRSSKDQHEVIPSEQWNNDAENEVESERPWHTIYKVEEELNLTESNLLTTLSSLPREWMVEFMLKPTNLGNPAWTNIFHMTIGGGGYPNGKIGERTPALFFNPSLGLHFASAHNGQANLAMNFLAPTVDKWTKLRMSQEMENGKIKLKFIIDDEEMLSVENSEPVGFENVKVYASDPWNLALPGFIKNLSIYVIKE